MVTTVAVFRNGDSTATGIVSRSKALLKSLGLPNRFLIIQCRTPVYVRPATTNITPTTATVVELKPDSASLASSTLVMNKTPMTQRNTKSERNLVNSRTPNVASTVTMVIQA